MIYLLTFNRIIDLDLKTILSGCGYFVRSLSIFELSSMMFFPEDLIILSNLAVEKNPSLRSLSGANVIVLSSQNEDKISLLNLPDNYCYLGMPFSSEEIISLVKSLKPAPSAAQ